MINYIPQIMYSIIALFIILVIIKCLYEIHQKEFKQWLIRTFNLYHRLPVRHEIYTERVEIIILKNNIRIIKQESIAYEELIVKKAIKELLDNSLNLVKITKRDLHTMYEEVEIEVELRVLPPKKD